MTVPQVNAADRSPVQQQADDQLTAADGERHFGPRSYQQDLIELATDNNVSMGRASADGVECLHCRCMLYGLDGPCTPPNWQFCTCQLVDMDSSRWLDPHTPLLLCRTLASWPHRSSYRWPQVSSCGNMSVRSLMQRWSMQHNNSSWHS